MTWELDSPAAADSAALDGRYRRFAEQRLVPLWAEVADLMPAPLEPAAFLHRWRWAELLPAALAGELVPVGLGGERRAIAPANPGLGGRPLATPPTIWAAIQYVNPREGTPTHRYSQHAFRFVAEGSG